jgi:hypothetical protein
LPTGFCLRSDGADYIGQGRSRTGTGAGSVSASATGSNAIEADLKDDTGQIMLTAEFAAPTGQDLELRRYDSATRYPFNMNNPGLDVTAGGRGCNTVKGEFTLTELGFEPDGTLSRLSVEFEQHCEGNAAALRGAINWNADGNPTRG